MPGVRKFKNRTIEMVKPAIESKAGVMGKLNHPKKTR